MRLRIAGLTIAVSSNDPAITPSVDAPSAAFLVNGDGPADVDVAVERVAVMPAPSGTPVFDSGGTWALFDDGGKFRIDCSSPAFGDVAYKVGYFDRDFTAGRVLMRADVFEGAVEPLQYPLDELIVGNLLARGRGVELHGCGIIGPDGRGRLFVGQSGAGKTTTARLWLANRDGIEIVSDDRVILREGGGEWRMYGTPWHGEAELASPSSAPLAAIYLLQQAPATRVVDISRATAAARLFGCTFPLFYDGRALAFTVDCIGRITGDVPVRVLEFTPDVSAIQAVS
jgi:hypothetical protein